jgi:pantoate--beta-alanine ligase
MRAARQSLSKQLSVGFVPTMGALHAGHVSLLERAKDENDVVVCSIFVNPIQFAPTDDLDRYPRQLLQDEALLQELGVHHLFCPPNPKELYGDNFLTYVDPVGFDDLTREGQARPGHFRGVATICTKLFNIVQPTRAYFGQKDATQTVLVQRLVADLNMNLDIIVVDTVREPDGLAMSSRNAYLSPLERAAAPIVYQALCVAQQMYASMTNESCAAEELAQAVLQTLSSEPLVSDIQYVSIDSRETMQPLEKVHKLQGAVVSVACKIGSVRLIDNIVLR